MIYLCDFEDSFSFNIYSEILLQGLELEVIPRKKVASFLAEMAQTKTKVNIILGPGPGHPSEYQDIKVELPRVLKNKNIFILGICLGHQFLSEAMGLKVERSLSPKHGENIEIELSPTQMQDFSLPQKLLVQRYNSLAVLENNETEKILSFLKLKAVFHQKELMLLKGERFISYQFHPESVGTTYRSCFFEALRNTDYN